MTAALAVDLRPEEPEDHKAIARIVEAAFGGPWEAQLVELIRASDRYVPKLALVATRDGEVVGHTMLSYVDLLADEELRVLILAPVAVAPEVQKRGVGGALVEAVVELAEARGEPLVVVQGHAAYYPRFGFAPARQHGIEPPSDDIPDAVFMVRRLSAYDAARHRGRVRYPPAFDVDEPRP